MQSKPWSFTKKKAVNFPFPTPDPDGQCDQHSQDHCYYSGAKFSLFSRTPAGWFHFSQTLGQKPLPNPQIPTFHTTLAIPPVFLSIS